MHKTRVGTRRLRSTLRNFGPALTSSPEALSALDDNLRWLAALLSPIRDGDILARRLKAEVAELPPERVLGPVVIEIEETLATERAAAIREWQQARSDERYTDDHGHAGRVVGRGAAGRGPAGRAQGAGQGAAQGAAGG